jgi:hypothetical protein
MPTSEIIETGAAALLWATIFLMGGRAQRAYSLVPDHRSVASVSAGVSVAYVFVHMMPELQNARVAFTASVSVSLRYEGMAIYFLGLLGFLTFRGLEHVRAELREAGAEEQAGSAFRLHLGGFSAYVSLMGYLLVNNLQETRTSIALYAIPVGIHFLAVDNSLRNEHGASYERIGRPLLAAMSVTGWGVGMLWTLPQHVIALLVAFLSGAIIMNSTMMELRSDGGGRFMPMMVGGVVYGLILLPFG